MKNEINAVPARLTTNGRKAITIATSSQVKANGRTSATVDQLVADGMLWTDFIAPSGEGSTSTPELHAALKAAIVEGFSASDRKLLATPTKALNDDNSAAKRLKQQSVGAFMGAFKRDLRHGKHRPPLRLGQLNNQQVRPARPAILVKASM